VLVFTAGLSLMAALLSGLAPAVRASRADVLSGLRNDGAHLGRRRLRHAFVVVQVAVTIVLIVGAGLFARALHRAASIDPGFESHDVELVSVDLAQAGHTVLTGPHFARELLDRVHQLPGVQAAALASSVPGGFEVWRRSVSVSPAGEALVGV